MDTFFAEEGPVVDHFEGFGGDLGGGWGWDVIEHGEESGCETDGNRCTGT